MAFPRSIFKKLSFNYVLFQVVVVVEEGAEEEADLVAPALQRQGPSRITKETK